MRPKGVEYGLDKVRFPYACGGHDAHRWASAMTCGGGNACMRSREEGSVSPTGDHGTDGDGRLPSSAPPAAVPRMALSPAWTAHATAAGLAAGASCLPSGSSRRRSSGWRSCPRWVSAPTRTSSSAGSTARHGASARGSLPARPVVPARHGLRLLGARPPRAGLRDAAGCRRPGRADRDQGPGGRRGHRAGARRRLPPSRASALGDRRRARRRLHPAHLVRERVVGPVRVDLRAAGAAGGDPRAGRPPDPGRGRPRIGA